MSGSTRNTERYRKTKSNVGDGRRAADVDCFSRVAPTDWGKIMRPMETGCSRVMAALVRTVNEVCQIVSWAKYAPVGTRGTFASNAECE
ncbi:MAG: hypothetical protein AAGD11_16960 [Planctomycetota bacterium]